MKCLASLTIGRSYGAYYKVSKKRVVLTNGSTGDNQYRIYRVSGSKATLIGRYKGVRKSLGNWSYTINGKAVSNATYLKKVQVIWKYPSVM